MGFGFEAVMWQEVGVRHNEKSRQQNSRHMTMKIYPLGSAIPRRVTLTQVNRSGDSSSLPKLLGVYGAVQRAATRIGCISVSLLLLSFRSFAQPSIPLEWYSFPPGPPAFATDLGSLPVAYTTNLISAPVSLDVDWWCPNALILDTTNITPAYLEYYVIDANFVQNISYSAPASILLYYSPDWQSVSLGGTGSGQNAILLAGGDWSPGSPNGLFRIYVDPAGSNLYFGGVTNGVVSNYVTVPIEWSSNSWHQVGIEWGVAGRNDSSAIYLDGALAAT